MLKKTSCNLDKVRAGSSSPRLLRDWSSEVWFCPGELTGESFKKYQGIPSVQSSPWHKSSGFHFLISLCPPPESTHGFVTKKIVKPEFLKISARLRYGLLIERRSLPMSHVLIQLVKLGIEVLDLRVELGHVPV